MRKIERLQRLCRGLLESGQTCKMELFAKTCNDF